MMSRFYFLMCLGFFSLKAEDDAEKEGLHSETPSVYLPKVSSLDVSIAVPLITKKTTKTGLVEQAQEGGAIPSLDSTTSTYLDLPVGNFDLGLASRVGQSGLDLALSADYSQVSLSGLSVFFGSEKKRLRVGFFDLPKLVSPSTCLLFNRVDTGYILNQSSHHSASGLGLLVDYGRDVAGGNVAGNVFFGEGIGKKDLISSFQSFDSAAADDLSLDASDLDTKFLIGLSNRFNHDKFLVDGHVYWQSYVKKESEPSQLSLNYLNYAFGTAYKLGALSTLGLSYESAFWMLHSDFKQPQNQGGDKFLSVSLVTSEVIGGTSIFLSDFGVKDLMVEGDTILLKGAVGLNSFKTFFDTDLFTPGQEAQEQKQLEEDEISLNYLSVGFSSYYFYAPDKSGKQLGGLDLGYSFLLSDKNDNYVRSAPKHKVESNSLLARLYYRASF